MTYPSMTLASVDRAVMNPTLATLNGNNPDALDALLATASEQIERECHRYFALQSYTEYLNGMGQPYDLIILKQRPVTAITRLATRPVGVILIQNTDLTDNQRATVATTSTGMILTTVSSGVTSTTTLLYSSYATLSALATAIVNLGSGWTAQVTTGYSLFPSVDLKPLQGAVAARGTNAALEMYIEDIDAWNSLSCWGGDEYGWVGSGHGWRLDADAGMISGRFPPGVLNIRCDYTAGYAVSSAPDSLPPQLQEACVEHAKDLYNANQIDWTLASVKLGPFSKTLNTEMPAMSVAVRKMLRPFLDPANNTSDGRP